MTDQAAATPLLLRTPAEAAAVGICILWRLFPATETHPAGGCRWCTFDRAVLVKALEYFEITADYDDTTCRYGADHVREFAGLPTARQRELVAAAQAVE